MFNPLNYILIEKYKKYNVEYINELPNYLLSYDQLKPFYEKTKNHKLVLTKDFINHFSNTSLNNEIKDDMKISNKEINVNQLTYKINKVKTNKYSFSHDYNLNYSYVPLNHKDAEKYVDFFIKTKLKSYKKTYLLINQNSVINHHSGFSALLNIGLITPNELFNKIKDPVFIRQLYIREYYNYIYLFYYNQIINENYWNLKLEWNKSLKEKLYNGKTEVEIFDKEFNTIYIWNYALLEKFIINNNIENFYDRFVIITLSKKSFDKNMSFHMIYFLV
jgi:deoxyribodipyrimidine photolyase